MKNLHRGNMKTSKCQLYINVSVFKQILIRTLLFLDQILFLEVLFFNIYHNDINAEYKQTKFLKINLKFMIMAKNKIFRFTTSLAFVQNLLNLLF